ncbi:acetyl-CoA carboxylase biotin carboxylase subunit family protein (plasmid) [Sinorhizobium kummerowiae]|uniref:Acetyl-CoA carboxylase biotin carboxylase subunit family protein n=1 Tax=Sinorhizobium kummerowiae TaxID=158892 RepID=A0ABY8TDI2_9HYPH|nr:MULTISPECIES: acetyl-CoA carboxylase biotin carboxylase subunit family protein [Sinorhizobium]RVN79285.1 ATP-grasp domain-containing protein [Sinorhizobium meliloti]WHS95870.1 acetyl-CoA carboxylase biotin carboxylase subunit family protein [Sinorhizobium kummerowiae]WQH41041.1 acetyl-CoA carboxylase biotin carboxylase subunit family protein [Sinorhizobium kummerowiae]
MAKRVLILIEGSRVTGPLYVQAAQHLGLHTITLSADPTQYDYIEERNGTAIRVDTGSLDALIGECSRLHALYDIAGITGALDSVYANVAKLCQYFDLPGPNPASIERCCDKLTQHQLLARAGIPIPAYRVAANAKEVESAVAEIGLPVILKPAAGSGSSGVRLCCTVDEVKDHATYLLGGTHKRQSPPAILVEEFAQGSHYVAHVMGTKVIGIELADFHRPPHFVFRQSTFPAQLTEHEHERVADVALRSSQALGLEWGPTNVEIRWTKRGPVVIEVNPRLAGAPDSQLVQLAHGVDLITEHIKLVIGEQWDLRKRFSYTAAARLLNPNNDGTLDWIHGVARAAAIPGIVEVKLYLKANTPAVRRGDYRDSLGHVIAASPTHSQTEAILQRAVDLIHWSITPFQTRDE